MILDEKSPADVHLMAHRAHEQLKSRHREIARSHADRMKQLSEVMRQISASDFNDKPTLAGIKGFSLSPELERLILNPTAGL
jgi:hypothetical protein